MSEFPGSASESPFPLAVRGRSNMDEIKLGPCSHTSLTTSQNQKTGSTL